MCSSGHQPSSATTCLPEYLRKMMQQVAGWPAECPVMNSGCVSPGSALEGLSDNSASWISPQYFGMYLLGQVLTNLTHVAFVAGQTCYRLRPCPTLMINC